MKVTIEMDVEGTNSDDIIQLVREMMDGEADLPSKMIVTCGNVKVNLEEEQEEWEETDE